MVSKGEEYRREAERLRAAQQRKNGKKRPDPLRIYSAAEFLAMTPEKPDWLAPGYLATGAVTMVVGKIKHGKSTLVADLVRAVTHGAEFLGQPTKRAKVLYITEQPRTSFRRLMEEREMLDDVFVLSRQDMRNREWGAVVTEAVQFAKDHGIDVLIVDTLTKLSGVKHENETGEAQEAMEPLQRAADDGLAVVGVQHARKSGGEVSDVMRGASAFGGDADIILVLSKPRFPAARTQRELSSESRFDETPDAVMIDLTDEGYRLIGDASVSRLNSDRSSIQSYLRTLGPDPITMSDLEAGTGLPLTSLKRAAWALETEGIMYRTGKGTRGDAQKWGLISGLPTREEEDGLSPKSSLNGLDPIIQSTYGF